MSTIHDVIVIGGGPAGATAAHDLARAGARVALLDRAGRIKPCGGAIPPCLLTEFEIDPDLLVARATLARVVAPSSRIADMPVGQGFVGMVDRDAFDEWLRERAHTAGAERRTGVFERLAHEPDGTVAVTARAPDGSGSFTLRARAIIGADGARSAVARASHIRGADRAQTVFAYHEIVRTPAEGLDPDTCEIHYGRELSPDFYAWVFPHGDTASVGTGCGKKGFSLKRATAELRARTGLTAAETLRREGAPIPMRPLPRWDDGRAVVLAGDAAGVVAPASGEGIYYAMRGGRLAADAAALFLRTGHPRALRHARRRFMREHGTVFRILGMMQGYWYANDRRRERFVSICRDRDVQELTWKAYMTKRLVRARPAAHFRVFVKNIAHLTGIASA